MTTPREKKLWWVTLDDRVFYVPGLSCAPENPKSWWFPDLGYTLHEGGQLHPDREQATAQALFYIDTEVGRLLKQKEALQAGKGC